MIRAFVRAMSRIPCDCLTMIDSTIIRAVSRIQGDPERVITKVEWLFDLLADKLGVASDPGDMPPRSRSIAFKSPFLYGTVAGRLAFIGDPETPLIAAEWTLSPAVDNF